jgi:uncharacterized OsmC-like protein
VRGIPTAENLVAEVEGDIENVDGAVKVTRIRVRYRLKIPKGTRQKAQRALETYADKCPAYLSVKGCVEVSSSAEIDEAPA